MPRADKPSKIWAEYDPSDPNVIEGRIVRVFTSATPALWSAVDHGNKVVGMLPGETLAEALERDKAEKTADEARKSHTSAPPSSGAGRGATHTTTPRAAE